jgi:hypothetical protein
MPFKGRACHMMLIGFGVVAPAPAPNGTLTIRIDNVRNRPGSSMSISAPRRSS